MTKIDKEQRKRLMQTLIKARLEKTETHELLASMPHELHYKPVFGCRGCIDAAYPYHLWRNS